VLNTGSAVTMPWANSVKGIIENWYPGQTDGTAIAALLYGDVNFSGKLPVTFPQSLADVPASTAAQWPGQNGTVQYSEGVDVGYRWYDAQNKTPLFPFGFGLSYTNFTYRNLTVGTPDANGNVAVGFDVQNTGTRAGAEIPQVYVGQPASAGEPPKNLRGFSRVSSTPVRPSTSASRWTRAASSSGATARGSTPAAPTRSWSARPQGTFGSPGRSRSPARRSIT